MPDHKARNVGLNAFTHLNNTPEHIQRTIQLVDKRYQNGNETPEDMTILWLMSYLNSSSESIDAATENTCTVFELLNKLAGAYQETCENPLAMLLTPSLHEAMNDIGVFLEDFIKKNV